VFGEPINTAAGENDKLMTTRTTKKGYSGATIGFEAKRWLAADKLRNNMDAAEYKHVALGLIFLKYIFDTFEEQRARLDEGQGDYAGANPEDPDEYKAENVFWVPADARWSHLQADARQPAIGKIVDDAMVAIERNNPPLKGVLPKDYARPGLDKHRLGELIDLIATIVLTAASEGEKTHRSVDLLGCVYECFLTRFASAEGKNGGQFYTPSCIVRLLVEMLAPHANSRIYDPCCGSGGMFVQSEKFIEEHGGQRDQVATYGQESNATTRRLAVMNLAICGFSADFAWVQHFIHHLAPAGCADFVLANGSMSSNQSGEGDIRRALIEADLVDGMVTLPGQLFYSTQIPVCLWFLAKTKRADAKRGCRDRRQQTLFIDARKLGALIDRVDRELTEADLQKITTTYHHWRSARLSPLAGEGRGASYADIADFCKSATSAEIAAHGHVLTPGRYVGAEEVEDDGDPFEEKMPRLVAELHAQFEESAKLEEAIKANRRGWVMAGKATVGNYVTRQRGITYKGKLVGKTGPALLGLGSNHPGGGFREGDYRLPTRSFWPQWFEPVLWSVISWRFRIPHPRQPARYAAAKAAERRAQRGVARIQTGGRRMSTAGVLGRPRRISPPSSPELDLSSLKLSGKTAVLPANFCNSRQAGS